VAFSFTGGGNWRKPQVTDIIILELCPLKKDILFAE
jgi:hypothetical protein